MSSACWSISMACEKIMRIYRSVPRLSKRILTHILHDIFSACFKLCLNLLSGVDAVAHIEMATASKIPRGS